MTFASDARTKSSTPRSPKRGYAPKPIEAFPRACNEQWKDPPTFMEALALHARRHGDSCWHLHRAVVRAGEKLDRKTLQDWIRGRKAPRSVQSFEILRRIERRYQLPEGYFQAKLPHRSRAAHGHKPIAIGPSERRRLAWHLPDDFNARPLAEQGTIVQWVQRNIVSGGTVYRDHLRTVIGQRYAVQFPELTPGTGMAKRALLAPPKLSAEVADLIGFKTSALTAAGLQRGGRWGAETASQKLEHIGLMLGALTAAPDSSMRGAGAKLQDLTLAILVFPSVWDWYIQWRERRRGFFTTWELDMLRLGQALCRREIGWLRQHGHHVQNARPIPGLVSTDDISFASRDWDAACDALVKHAAGRAKEIKLLMRVHRDPFEPIMPILEADNPVGEYRKITDEIQRRMPDADRYPRAAAEAARSFLMLRFGLHLGLRQKNLRELMFCPRGRVPRSERQLEDGKRGEVRWSDKAAGWEVLVPAVAFKNAGSSYFGGKPFRLVLPDLAGLYGQLSAYVDTHRSALLGGAADPGTFFVKTAKTTSRRATYDDTTFYQAWRLTIERYGVFNPYTGRGAIEGLLPHGPHSVRDVLATHILKRTGSYEQASYAIQDTPDTVRSHYGRFLPQDKAAMAARILNEAWGNDASSSGPRGPAQAGGDEHR